MAIKGKRKHKSGHKPKPSAPKREAVVPKGPLLGRKGFQMAVAAGFALAIGLGLGYGFGNQASLDAEAQASQETKKSAASFQQEVDTILKQAGDVTPSGFTPYPDLLLAMDRVDSNKDVAAALKDSRRVGTDARAVTTALDALQLEQTTTGIPARDAADQFGIRAQLAQGSTLFAETARILDQAAHTEGRVRKELLGTTAELHAAATAVFDEGYRRYQNVLLDLGVVEPAPPGVPQPFPDPSAGLPQGTTVDPTTGLPLEAPVPPDPASQQAP